MKIIIGVLCVLWAGVAYAAPLDIDEDCNRVLDTELDINGDIQCWVELPPNPPDDADGDGVIDSEDLCPDEPGLPGNGGCPVVDPDPTPTGDRVARDGWAYPLPHARRGFGGNENHPCLDEDLFTMPAADGADTVSRSDDGGNFFHHMFGPNVSRHQFCIYADSDNTYRNTTSNLNPPSSCSTGAQIARSADYYYNNFSYVNRRICFTAGPVVWQDEEGGMTEGFDYTSTSGAVVTNGNHYCNGVLIGPDDPIPGPCQG